MQMKAQPATGALFFWGEDMSRPLQKSNFYKSTKWKNARAAYLAHCGGWCERCLAKGQLVPAEIVHHKTYLTEDNYTDPETAYSFENLEAVCMTCHNIEHFGNKDGAKRYKIENGKLVY